MKNHSVPLAERDFTYPKLAFDFVEKQWWMSNDSCLSFEHLLRVVTSSHI